MREHLLGRVDGLDPGPLIVVVGAVHGNEPAGVTAIRRLLDVLTADEPLLRGRVVGLLGHPEAYARGVRQVDEDLNRVFTPARLADLRQGAPRSLEAACAKTLLATLAAEVADYAPEELVVVDLHTTSADGGDFVAMGDQPATVELGRGFGAPVVLGLTSVLPGTLCGYLDGRAFGVPTRAFGYEAGAHDGPESPDRAYALLVALLTRLGMAAPEAFGPHDPLTLGDPPRPALSEVVFRLGIPPGGQFTMMPGYRNFDPVQAGQVIAYLDGESVALERGGYLLMPLYQGMGRDGFFIVEARV